MEGKKKRSGDSCMVRGFLGDIINSPYIPFGVEVNKEEDRVKFNKEYNFQRPYHCTDISAYNLSYYMTLLEKLEEFKPKFEIIDKIEAERKNKTQKKPE